MEEWLGAGHFVSEAVLASAQFDRGTFRTCVGDDIDVEEPVDFETGWMIKTREADFWLAQVLDELSQEGARCAIGEDDLSGPTDPGFIKSPIPSAFINDRVLCWSNLTPGNGATAVRPTMRIGSGYPSNAFVVSRTSTDLGLADRQQVAKGFLSQVQDSLMAVTVAIFDAESYLVWTPS